MDLLSGRVAQVIAELRRLAGLAETTTTQRTVLTQVANYFERNRTYMPYDQYLADGWPIASRVIEGACRHLVKDRCELSGMRWTPTGVEALLGLRAVAENGDWEAYRRFLQQQRQLRLYRVPEPAPAPLERQALADPEPMRRPRATEYAFIMPTLVARRSTQPHKRAA